MYKLAGAVAALALTTSSAWAQSPPLPNSDFVMHASVGNTFEIEESKLALERASDPRIKAFAKQMILDHTSAEKKLEEAAGKEKLKTEPMLDETHKAMLDNLKTFDGPGFDKIYMADQIASHVETVALLSDYKVNGKDASLKGWADKSLPVVKGHLEMIQAM
jgi:putative membrane protein